MGEKVNVQQAIKLAEVVLQPGRGGQNNGGADAVSSVLKAVGQTGRDMHNAADGGLNNLSAKLKTH